MDIFNKLPPLLLAIEQIYEPAGMRVTKEAILETESAEYGACRFELEGRSIVFRVAKTTPTKVGQFVTVWKRLTRNAAIVPFDVEDNINFLVVAVSDATHRGQFVFDAKILIEQGIMSSKNRKGKLAFRLYAPWIHPTAKAAIKTQKWQLPYFFDMPITGSPGLTRIRRLFNLSL